MSYFRQWLLASALLLIPSAACFGETVSITVPNFSFEAPGVATPPGWNTVVPTNWNYTGNSSGTRRGVQTFAIAGFTGAAPADGNVHFYINHLSNSDPTPYVTSPVVVSDILPNTNYTLTVALGNRGDFVVFNNSIEQAMNVPFQYELQLLVDGQVKASRVIGGVALPGDENFIPEHGFRDFSLSLSSADVGEIVGGELTIRLRYQGGTYVGQSARAQHGSFDNVRLTATAIPEPSACVLVGLGLLGMTAYRKRHVRR